VEDEGIHHNTTGQPGSRSRLPGNNGCLFVAVSGVQEGWTTFYASEGEHGFVIGIGSVESRLMNVSVIIPVFNAAAYVEQAVASALAQTETGEVLLVEDGSQDGSLAECRKLVGMDNRIKLLRHPDGRNLGAGASRNLGIKASTCSLTAFLDADDFYLPGRFAVGHEILAAHSDADGVYETTGFYFQDDNSMRRWKEAGWPEKMGLRRWVDPAQLFETLAGGGAGSFSTDGIVVRRSLFEKSGYFNPELRTEEDTHLWIRMAAVGRLYPGRTDCPVSMCRIHAGNRVTGRPRKDQQEAVQQVWADLVRWGRAKGLPVRWIQLLARRYAAASAGLVMKEHLIGACGAAMRSCGFLIRYCPQPWRVEGFAYLAGAASVVGLAGQRLADYVRWGTGGCKGGGP